MMTIDSVTIHYALFGLLTVIGVLIKMEVHDMKSRVKRIEDAFILAGAQAFINGKKE
jgi:hypothetical protein